MSRASVVLSLSLLAFALPLASACASTSSADGAAEVPPGAEQLVISLQDINCQSCGAACVKSLEQKPGVVDVTFDRDAAELTVVYASEEISPEQMKAAIVELGYGAAIGAGKGGYAPEVEFEPAMDVAWISEEGEDVDLEAQLADGKYTVVDFYADWCGPCRDVDRAMFETLKARDDVALRKINVVDWSTPVAERYLKEVPQLPYVIVYGPGGERVDAIAGLDLDRLRAALGEDAS